MTGLLIRWRSNSSPGQSYAWWWLHHCWGWVRPWVGVAPLFPPSSGAVGSPRWGGGGSLDMFAADPPGPQIPGAQRIKAGESSSATGWDTDPGGFLNPYRANSPALRNTKGVSCGLISGTGLSPSVLIRIQEPEAGGTQRLAGVHPRSPCIIGPSVQIYKLRSLPTH